MKTIFFTILFLCGMIRGIEAQEQELKIVGKPIVQLFTNYQAGLGKANHQSGFELGRAYVGYAFKVTEQLSGKVVFNIGSTKLKGAEYERVAYIKNAMLTWKPGRFSLDFGLVGCQQWTVQQKFWSCRYILKSFQDEYKFGSAADLGIIGKYQFADWISADVSFVNGEGYKKLNLDNKYRYALGITLLPFQGMTVRVYGDIYNPVADTLTDQRTLALFAGYKNDYFSLGAEYNMQNHTQFISGHDQSGCSVYSLIKFMPKIDLLGRYDYIQSRHDWNAADEQQWLAGIQYQPMRLLILALNYKSVIPRLTGRQAFVGVNAEFKL